MSDRALTGATAALVYTTCLDELMTARGAAQPASDNMRVSRYLSDSVFCMALAFLRCSARLGAPYPVAFA